MKRIRISMLGLMGIVLVAGLLFAILRAESGMVQNSDQGWANAAGYFSFIVLVMATYRARYRNGTEGDWWFGFALGGWSYYLLSADMLFSGDVTHQWMGLVEPTHKPMSLIASLPHRIVDLFPNADIWVYRAYQARIAQAFLVLFAAIVGGFVSLALSWRRRSRQAVGVQTSRVG
jgi:hypothetical protein